MVLTVKDSAGSAVSGAQPAAAAKDPIVAPDGDDAVGVTTDPGVAKAESKAGAGDGIPDCATGTDDDGQCVVQVTAQVKADAIAEDNTTDPPTPAVTEVLASATRGPNTLNFMLARTAPATPLTAAAEVTVAGIPDTIETDAPETIDDLGDATISVTVKDDEQVLVGVTDVTIVKVAGQGIIGDGSKGRRHEADQ